MFDWQDLYFFSVLARTQSLSAAARELGVEHATVGRRLESLEQAFGMQLVDRLPRSRPLTEDGRAVAAIAESMQEMAHSLERRARAASADLAGSVRVSAPPSVAAACITPRIAALREHYPNLSIVLLPSTALASLNTGEADIAIRTVRPEENGLLCRQIGVVRFGLYATAAFSRRPPEQWTFIAYDESLDHLPQQAWLHHVRAGRPIVFAASELNSQQIAARGHVGAVVLPTIVGDNDPALVRLAVELEAPVRAIWITAYPDIRRTPSVSAVMEFLVDCIQREPKLQG
jgi:DNA-binding transcriptional LysR family regulator